MSERFVICVSNDTYPVSLEKRKLYEAIADPEAERIGQLRIRDESGDDYLYPRELFVEVDLPAPVRKAVSSS